MSFVRLLLKQTKLACMRECSVKITWEISKPVTCQQRLDGNLVSQSPKTSTGTLVIEYRGILHV